MGGIVNWRFILVLVIVLPCLAVQAHYFPKHRHLHHPKHHGHKPGAGRSLLTQADAPTYDDKHKHEHHHEHHHDHDHKHDHDHDHKHHPFYAPSYAPAHHPEHHPKHHHPTHGPVYAPTHQPVHHQDHKHDHDHDHKHHPKHLLLFVHEIKKNISGVQWGNKSKEEEFDRIRTVSAVLKEGKFNESKIVGSQLGIVVVGKEHIYTSFSYFLHGHGTIAVQGFIHGGKAKEDEKDEDGKDKEDRRAKEERVLAVVGGTGDFLSVTGVDRSVFHHEKGVDVDVHRLTLDYPKHWE